jgi:hypothetical protein
MTKLSGCTGKRDTEADAVKRLVTAKRKEATIPAVKRFWEVTHAELADTKAAEA